MLALLLAVLIQPAFATWSEVSLSDFKSEAPPAAESPKANRDMGDLVKVVKSRTDKDCKLATFAANAKLKELFVESGEVTAEDMDRVLPTVQKSVKVAIGILGPLKKKYPRLRPYVANREIKVCPGVEKSPSPDSFPSGHAVVAYTAGCTLAIIYPDRATKLNEWSERMAHQRLVAGMHFASDVAASKRIALAVCERVSKEKDFIAEVESARKT